MAGAGPRTQLLWVGFAKVPRDGVELLHHSYQRELDSGQLLIQFSSLLHQAHERIRWIVGLTVAMPALARNGGAVTKFARYENAN